MKADQFTIVRSGSGSKTALHVTDLSCQPFLIGAFRALDSWREMVGDPRDRLRTQGLDLGD